MSCQIVCYTYDADNHCLDCTSKEHRSDAHGHYYGEDKEGNAIYPLFAVESGLDSIYCGTCFIQIQSETF